MENLISFVEAYVAQIIAVIFGITAVYFHKPVESSNPVWNAIVKIAATLLGILVIVVCYIKYTSSPPPPPPTTVPTIAVTENAPSVTEASPVNPAQTAALFEDGYAIVEASSTYSGDRATHGAYQLIDNKPKTNWTEGVSGNGEGEYIDFIFNTEQPVAGFTIFAGNHNTESYYDKNSRPKSILLTFSDGSSAEYYLRDRKEAQTVYFEKVVKTSSIRLTITSVYSGSAYEDTVISEIDFLVQKT